MPWQEKLEWLAIGLAIAAFVVVPTAAIRAP